MTAEGVASRKEDGIAEEAAFMSFLLLDQDVSAYVTGRHLAMEYSPGATKVKARLGL